jgi:hypothetical protein
MSPPQAQVLQAGTPEHPEIHDVLPMAIPSNSIEIERC